MNLTLSSLIALMIAFLLIKFATKFLYKLLGYVIIFLIAVYLMFHFGIGPFSTNPVSIFTLEEKYCNKNQNNLKCNCIVQFIRKDMDKRWSYNELQEMRKSREIMAYSVKRSFDKVKPEIELCLKEQNKLEELTDFKRDLIPVENDILEKISDLKKELTDKSKNALDSLVNSKKTVDDRYAEP